MEKSVRRLVGGGGRSLGFPALLWRRRHPNEKMCLGRAASLKAEGCTMGESHLCDRKIKREEFSNSAKLMSSRTLSGSSLCLSLWAARERTEKVPLDSPHEQ